MNVCAIMSEIELHTFRKYSAPLPNQGKQEPIFWPDLQFRGNELKALRFLAKLLWSAFHC